MPLARPQKPPISPIPLTEDEAKFIRETVVGFYGPDAVLRNFGVDPARLGIHVEADRDLGMGKYDCIGVLLTRINRPMDFVVTRRGTRIFGMAKVAYRQGVVF